MLFDRRSREGIEESRPALVGPAGPAELAALVGLVGPAARVELAALAGPAVDSIIVQSFDHTETPV